jgi:hypothetical protein
MAANDHVVTRSAAVANYCAVSAIVDEQKSISPTGVGLKAALLGLSRELNC